MFPYMPYVVQKKKYSLCFLMCLMWFKRKSIAYVSLYALCGSKEKVYGQKK